VWKPRSREQHKLQEKPWYRDSQEEEQRCQPGSRKARKVAVAIRKIPILVSQRHWMKYSEGLCFCMGKEIIRVQMSKNLAIFTGQNYSQNKVEGDFQEYENTQHPAR
jgi:hypothetical protein